MLDMGFVDIVKKIVAKMPKERQTVLYSATWPQTVALLAKDLTRRTNFAQVAVGGMTERAKANDKVDHTVEIIQGKAKYARLTKILRETKSKKTLVFGLYKKEVASLENWLKQEGFKCVALQGDMNQNARNQALENFKTGKIPMLLATDVAGRGIDVNDVELVVNYTFPLTIEDLVHRIGRTARAGKSGQAVTFFNLEGDFGEKQHAQDLVNLLEDAKQKVPEDLRKAAEGSGGQRATKKKAHPLFGNHFVDEVKMAKMMEKKVHVTFADSDDE
jgi:ATP-dependent RNA helicase DBP3